MSALGPDEFRIRPWSSKSSDWTTPARWPPNTCLGIYVSGSYAYLANLDDGLRIYRLTSVTAPTAGIGSLDAGNAVVRNNLIVNNDAHVRSGLTAGGRGIHVENGGGIKVDGNGVFLDKLGIGIDSAIHRLHVHELSSSRAYAHFTNETTGNTDGNGVAVGLDQDEDFRVHSFESNNLKFFVNNSEAFRVDSSRNVGIGISNPTHLLHVNGIARSTQSTWATSSDRRVKTNIKPLEGSLEKIRKLNPVTFEYIPAYSKNNKALTGRKTGFIAQEVAKVDPTMVGEVVETIGYQTIENFHILNTDNMIPMLIDALKEQQAQIENLKAIVCADHPEEAFCQ